VCTMNEGVFIHTVSTNVLQIQRCSAFLIWNACKNNYQMLIHILCGIQVF